MSRPSDGATRRPGHGDRQGGGGGGGWVASSTVAGLEKRSETYDGLGGGGVAALHSGGLHFFFLSFFVLLNSVYIVLPLSQGSGFRYRVKGGTIHMKTVKLKYVHTKLCVYTEYY